MGVPAKPNLRKTNPNFFRALLVFGTTAVALGLNFHLTTPTFEQFGIPKEFLGLIFGGLGSGIFIGLFVWRSLKALRLLMLANSAAMVFWGVGSTQTFFEGSSSLQLCILYFGLAALQGLLLLEPYFNPVTSNEPSEAEED